MPISTAQETPDPVSRAIRCLEGFIEASVVTWVSALLSSLCEIGPPIILDLSNIVLEDAANETGKQPPPLDITADPGVFGRMISSWQAVL